MNDIEIGGDNLASFDQAASREWLVANGLGGFAAGTLGEANTRRYHGLLIAALTPPLGRTMTVAKLDVTAHYGAHDYPLTSNEFVDGVIDPQGYNNIERFRLECGLPVWEYRCGEALVEKRVVMPHGENTTLVRYRIIEAAEPVELTLRPLCAYRDYHSHIQGGWDFGWESLDDGFRITAYDGATPYDVRIVGAADVAAEPNWYWHFRHRVEAFRGLDESEDLFSPGLFRADLAVGEAVTVVISTETSPSSDFEPTHAAEKARRKTLIEATGSSEIPGWVQQLQLAADQFLVSRRTENEEEGRTVIAGYPWFGDWGRDTMIALPGLTLTTGRFDDARDILRTFAEHVDQGMLPNRFPDSGEQPEYNTVDATLWYLHAVDQYARYSGDIELVESLYPVLRDIIAWHRRGTRYGIQVDPEDGLLMSGEDGVQLTWMDAKVGDWVVTARTGKAVEINALWYNALRIMATLAEACGDAAQALDYKNAAARVKTSFQRFWNDERGCLHDVIDGPEGETGGDGRNYDARLRPNQLFAVSLPHTPLKAAQQKSIVDVCARELLTPYGLRSLARGEPGYVEHYSGNQLERDGAYHQGTVWAWLIGPFVDAHFRVYQDVAKARSYLEPLGAHLSEACIGSISEIFDAEPPHTPRGCFAQAWSVSEVLRAWWNLKNTF